MATIKSHTDLEQSKKLAEILQLESSDMYWRSLNLNGHISWTSHIKRLEPPIYDLEHYIPCWSLAALLSVLPSSIKDSIGVVYSLNMNKEYIEYSNHNISSLCSAYIHTCGNDNLVDACYELILKLHELKML